MNDTQLNLKDLEQVCGGVNSTAAPAGQSEDPQSSSDPGQLMRMECPFCHDIFQANIAKPSVKCPTCHKMITIKG